ncbi:hypothetical protein GCM10027262_14350 [Nocardia tengchongensis]
MPRVFEAFTAWSSTFTVKLPVAGWVRAADQPAGVVAFAAKEGQGKVDAFDLTEPSFVVCAVAELSKVGFNVVEPVNNHSWFDVEHGTCGYRRVRGCTVWRRARRFLITVPTQRCRVLNASDDWPGRGNGPGQSGKSPKQGNVGPRCGGKPVVRGCREIV